MQFQRILLVLGVLALIGGVAAAGALSPGPGLAGVAPLLLGDVDCDGSVNSIDAVLVLQYDAGLASSLPCQLSADTNDDGSAGSADSALILQFDAGLISALRPLPRPIVFLRPNTRRSLFQPYGVLRMLDSDSSSVRQLTPSGEEASFVGLTLEGKESVVYYLAASSDTAYALRRRNLATKEVTTLNSFTLRRVRSDKPPSGDLDPTGRYVAFHHDDGIDLYDVAQKQRRRILTNDRSGCDFDYSHCFGFFAPRWSPDGRLLLVRRIFFEGGDSVITDPFDSTEEFTSLGTGTDASWSPASDAVCHSGFYIRPTDLFVSRAPDWRSQAVISAEDLPRNFDCVWLDNERIAFLALMEVGRADEDGEIWRLNLSTGIRDLVVSGLPRSSGVYYLGGGLLATNTIQGSVPFEVEPVLVNLDSGTLSPLLRPGDWIVATVGPAE